jgi:hypothetical protein
MSVAAGWKEEDFDYDDEPGTAVVAPTLNIQEWLDVQPPPESPRCCDSPLDWPSDSAY